ncbi:XRE family transcriptional regulator [Streptomyces sp. A1277]|uniref:MmyB family transcriptional regulator n=1 Tax=Streptomyces sp. A1277 TaxID=2563103 RepID=UPI0010A2A285|nr:helix-turn-helix domain-containing protein [Streptomyces sp. A1277]THA29224.1 XRE family transcriptional regulator [Streptomyces sp. A1277]
MHKQSLRQFLKERRARIQPETVGLTRPAGRGRRAKGLSQQQLDQLLGRGTHAYHFLENGKYPNPPVDLLYDLGRLLRLTEDEWVMLNRYAREQEPPGPLNPDSGYQVLGTWEDAVAGMDNMAYMTDAAWNVLTYNPAFVTMFPDRQVPDNVLRWMCLDRGAREVLTDWETAWAPRIFPQLRAALAAGGNPYLRQLEADILADPVTAPLYYCDGVVNHPDGDERPFRHPIAGPGWITICSAAPHSSPGARLVVLVFRAGERRVVVRPPLRVIPAPDPQLKNGRR